MPTDHAHPHHDPPASGAPGVDLEDLLRPSGFRVTGPRRAVWDILASDAGHLTVDEVVARLAQRGLDVDVASVYRTLALFEELGVARVTRLGIDDAGRWERAHPDEHFHLVCTGCGEVDHHVGSLVAQVRAHLDDGHDFAVDAIQLVVTGRCSRCRTGAGAGTGA
jgi:Fur family transcriptional regulator, ferric uptake regulator